MAEIAVLRHDEGIRVNGRRVVELYDELGAAAAERVIGRATEELAVALQAVVDRGRAALAQWDHAQDARSETTKRVERLGALAWQVGLASLAHVATDVAVCAAHSDAATFAAVLARLDRVGNRSLTAVWDSQDIRR